MTATTQPGVTLEEQETRLGGVLAIKREPHYTGVNLPFDLADSILASLIRLREIEGLRPAAWIEHHKGGANLNWEEVSHPYAKATPLYDMSALLLRGKP